MKSFHILSHRGWWKAAAEQNTLTAFERSFAAGFGIETDIRDADGHLVVSHDLPTGATLLFNHVLELWNKHGNPGVLALNVKADGLSEQVAKVMAGVDCASYFLFDMSVPDMRCYLNAGLPVYARHSEYEPSPAFYDEAIGIWLDAFRTDWASPDIFRAHSQAGKKLALVSPELHGRKYRPVWDNWRLWREEMDTDLLLCTDFPKPARDFFDV